MYKGAVVHTQQHYNNDWCEFLHTNSIVGGAVIYTQSYHSQLKRVESHDTPKLIWNCCRAT